MSEWRDVVLGDLCERVTVGHVGRMSDRYVDDGVPFLRSQNIKPFVIDRNGMLRVDEDFHRKLAKSRLAAGDVVVVRTGYPGTAAVVPSDLDGSNCADLVVITPGEDLNPHLLAAVFNSSWGRSAVGGHLVGAAQQHFNIGSAKMLRLRLPSRHEQDQIAVVLCALHDLIENNRRRVEVLEEMARAIYREWFVHFRYPGHEDVPLVDSPLGPIPDGWQIRRLDEFASLVRGRSYRKHELVDVGGRPFVNLKCMMRGGGFRRDGLKRYDGKFTEAQLVNHGDVVLAVTDLTQGREILARATLVPRLPEPGVISLDVARIVPDEPADRLWLFAVLRWSDFADRVKEFANGSTVLHLSPDHVAAGQVLWPPGDLRASLAAALDAALALVDELLDGSDQLTGLRDLLLPKLVTGQIDVSHLDLDALTEAAVG